MAKNNIDVSGGLFTHHFVESLQQDTFNHPSIKPDTFTLPGENNLSEKELETKIATAWSSLTEHWDTIEREFGQLDISDLRRRWMRPLFFHLNFNLEFQRADIVLEGELRFPISHIGRAGTQTTTVPVHSVLYQEENTLETRQGRGRGFKSLAPQDMVQRFLNLSKEHDWAILTDGVYLRLLRDFHHTYTRGYVQFDLQGIFGTRDYAAFRGMYRLLHASRFIPGAEEEAYIDKLYEDSLATGVKVGEDLRGNVSAAIKALANGFLTSTPGFLDKVRQMEDGETQLYREVLMVIYRILFLLFAEQRGMLPGRGSLYMDEFSLTAFRTLAEQPFGEDRNIDLWEKMVSTFTMVEHGVEDLGIYPYNGALFSLNRTPLLTPENPQVAPTCRNDRFLTALKYLTTVSKEKVLQRISYADLSVEEIGSIYESLLEYTPGIADSLVEIEGETIPTNTFFLDPRSAGRKTTGSYYTRPSLVNELIRSALVPVMEERIREVVPGYDSEYTEALNDEERIAAEFAILNLKVVDPAAGSGAFLIAANNKLGFELARIRSGYLFPAETEIRKARRDVLANCIYAVDLNPMAVELCKVSLWINAAVEDAPLNFLDHHIKCGNSLVGTSLELIKDGIPDGAYKPVTGDDKDLSRQIKAQNRSERGGQLSLMRVTVLKTAEELSKWVKINQLAEESPNQAESQYYAFFSSEDYWTSRLPYDLWTAAFFSTQKKGSNIPTTQDVNQARQNPELVDAKLVESSQKLARQFRFFHWHVEFPLIFNVNGQGGFDVVLGNPPWEKIQPEEKEFFLQTMPEIASASGSKRKKFIKNLSKENPGLWMDWQKHKSEIEKFGKFVRDSNKYQFSSSGNLNTATLFTDVSYTLVSSIGKVGIIVPSSIATNYITRDFLGYLFKNQAIHSIYDFENSPGYFPGVHRSFRFCLLTLTGLESSTPYPEFIFNCKNVDDLNDDYRRYSLNQNQLDLFSPNTGTIPTFLTKYEALLTEKLYKSGKVLLRESPEDNPWEINIYAEFLNMTRASNLFRTNQELHNKGFTPKGNIFFGRDSHYLPIYEARMITHYDHRSASVDVNPKNVFRSAVSKETLTDEHINADYSVFPRYWLDKNDFTNPNFNSYKKNWFMGFRMVTSSTNERTMVISVFPRLPYVNTISVI